MHLPTFIAAHKDVVISAATTLVLPLIWRPAFEWLSTRTWMPGLGQRFCHAMAFKPAAKTLKEAEAEALAAAEEASK